MEGTEIAVFGSDYNSMKGHLTYQRTDYSIPNNNSIILIRFYMTNTHSQGHESTYGNSGYIYINDIWKANGKYYLPPKSETLLASHYITVSHNSDGSFPKTWLSVNIKSAQFKNGKYVNAWIPAGTYSRIPRNSSITAYNGTLNSSTRYDIGAAASGFTHKITYSAGGHSGTITSSTGGGTHYWTPSLSLADGNGYSTSISCTLSCYTNQSGGTTSSSCTLTIPNNSSTQPTIDSFSIAPSNTFNSENADINKMYLQNVSAAKITLSASGQHSAGISKYTTTVQGRVYTKSSFTTDYFHNSGNTTISTTVTDTRGFTKATSKTIEVVPYNLPYISHHEGENEIICKRCDEAGNIKQNGTSLKIKCKVNYASVKNKNNVKLFYRHNVGKDIFSDWQELTLSNNQVDVVVLKDSLKLESNYQIEIRVKDLVGKEQVLNYTIPTEAVTLHLNKNGKGIGIGQYSQVVENEKRIDIAGDWLLYHNNNPLPIYNVGQIYISTSATSPAAIFGGNWEKQYEDKYRIPLGSLTVWGGKKGSGIINKTTILGSYQTRLLDGLDSNITIPKGYHTEFRLSFQGTTGGGNSIYMGVNNIETGGISTWSSDTFRQNASTPFFSRSDLILEPTHNYPSTLGTNIYYRTTNADSTWAIGKASLSCFLTSDYTLYYWKKIG